MVHVDVRRSLQVYPDTSTKATSVIGEMKRNLITPQDWQTGDISSKGSQKKLSQELRGCVAYTYCTSYNNAKYNSYAHKYRCPQIFCFDGQTLLLFQFRTPRLDKIIDEDCPVDCWVLPRTSSYCTLRYALYRLLAQGWRRCQGMSAADQLTVGELREHSREFFLADGPSGESTGSALATIRAAIKGRLTQPQAP